MDKKPFSIRRHSLLMPRDEQSEYRYGPKNGGFAFFASSSSSSTSFGSTNGGIINGNKQQNNEGGPLNSLRRSLRQINPFKNRLFRLPATPRLSRSKKVLARGEDFTNWNFERPSEEDNISANNSFSDKHGDSRDQSKIKWKTQVETDKDKQDTDQYSQINLGENNDLDEFLSIMAKITNKNEIGGSCRLPSIPDSFNQNSQLLEKNSEKHQKLKGDTVIGIDIKFNEFFNESQKLSKNGKTNKIRSRPCIPSFQDPKISKNNNEEMLNPPINNNNHCYNQKELNIKNKINHQNLNCYNMLPSTRYAPDGEIYAACWRNNHYQQPNIFLPNSSQPPPSVPAAPQTQNLPLSQRPQNLPLKEFISPQIKQKLEKEENLQLAPKSPSHSAITLLNINGCNNVQQQQICYANNNNNNNYCQIQTQNASSSTAANSIRFPRTQLLQRRRSAAANSPSENPPPLERHQRPQRSRSNREKSADCEFEKDERFKQWNACYYGRDVVKLMERHMKRKIEIENNIKKKLELNEENEENENKNEENKIEKLLEKPPLIFNFEEELIFASLNTENEDILIKENNKTNFVGRKWIFNKLVEILKEDQIKIILLVGASGTGKSAIFRYLIENSHFGKKKVEKRKTSSESSQQQQNNTVDSGIVVSAISTNPSPLGSQTSLNEDSSPQTSEQTSFYFISQNICAFHLAHLHDSKSCSIPEFIRNLSAQLCEIPQLKQSYGKIIRSNPTLYQLATDHYSSLEYSSLDLFRKLILNPISQIYNNVNMKRIDDKNEKEVKSLRWQDSSSSSLGCCYGSNCDCPCSSKPYHQQQKEKIPQLILILVDGLDEANFHQTDGNESIGSLLGRSINEWPQRLKFICSTSTNEKSKKNDFLNIFGINLKGKKLEKDVRVIQIDELNSIEDAKIYVEMIMKLKPMLEKRLTSQFRRHSFFASVEDNNPNSISPQTSQLQDIETNPNKFLFSEFVTNLVNRVHANFLSINLALDLLTEGRLSFSSLPEDANLSEIYGLYFRHKFPSPTNFKSSISPLLSVLIASLNPLTIEKLLNILNISSDLNNIQNIESLNERITTLWPLIGINKVSKHIVPMHSSLREWLLGDGSNTEFSIDIRHGHILIALWIVFNARKNVNQNSSEQLFELSHHLLKANPHKYAQPDLINSKIGIKMPWSRNAQIKWLKMATDGEDVENSENFENEKKKEEKIEEIEKCSKLVENALLYRQNIFYTNSKISKLLLLAGANPNAHKWSNGDNEPLLSAFVRAGNVEMIKLLLKFGADPNLGNPLPLLIALEQQRVEIIKILCNSGTDPFNKLNNDGESALLFTVKNNYCCDIISFLLNSNGKINEENEFLNSTKIHPQSSSSSTFSFDNLEEIKIFKSNRSDGALNKSLGIDEAFQAASERGNTRICSLFLDYDNKNDKSILDTSGALSTACINSHSELIQLFLSRGVQPYLNGHNSWKGRLALNCAVECGYLDLVVKILNNEENNEENSLLNAQEGPEGFTPLITAARHGRVGLVDLLINRGANLDKTDNQGRSAIFHAIEEGHFSTAGLLLEKGCNPCIIVINGNTLLHILAKRPNRGLIGQLLEMGISLEGRNGKGLRPIEVAIQNAQLQSVDIFLRRGARLRSLTWQIAFETHPPLVLMLLRKLLEDAQFLLRRRRNTEAEHRFTYALQKFVEIEKFGEKYLKKELSKGEEEEKNWKEKEFEFNVIERHVKRFKIHTLHSMAALKRKANRIEEAISLITEAIEIINVKGINEENTSISSSDEEDIEFDNLNPTDNIKLKCQQQRLFELHLLRAKCHFDARNMANARLDAHLASSLRPEDQEAKSLAAILNLN